jgi:hypothetical protein
MDNIKIPSYNIYLNTDKYDGVPSVRPIRAFDVNDVLIFTIEVDERMYNTISFSKWHIDNYPSEINYLKENFDSFKKSQICYGTFVDGVGYEGTKPLLADDYLNYLKSEIRNESINKILENE